MFNKNFRLQKNLFMFFSTDGETDDWFIKNFDYSIYNSIKI